MKNTNNQQIKLPKLPYGEGSMSIRPDGTIMYRKRIGNPKVEKTVYDTTPQKCLRKMKELEQKLEEENIDDSSDKTILIDAMNNWLENIKKPALKSQSYTRLKSTINNQIEKSSIGHLRYMMINSNQIQKLINDLNEKHYSYSVIKKTYDALNDFFRYESLKYGINNPMSLVVMPINSNINAETRTVEFFENDDIKKFIDICDTKYHTGTYKFKYGYALAANIYLGMRMGEYLALQWKDIDFDSNTIYIYKTLIQENNPEYDVNNPQLMKEKRIKKIRFIVQQSTKKSKNRYIPINDKAKQLLLKYKKIAQYTDPNDYVLSTQNRKTSTIKNMSDIIKAMEREADTEVQSCGTHILRHTCASLYFRAGVPIETICAILGNTREVCEKTYIHFIEEQLQSAAKQMANQISNINV